MISFDSVTLKFWLEQNAEFMQGARIQKIQQPTRREIILSLRKNGESKKLYINIDPKNFHICFMHKTNEEKRLIEMPQNPPMFCMLLRKYIENSIISKVCQPKYERMLELYIETYNELSEKIYLCLAIELMGKYSNIILYNYDTNIILGCAHNVGSEKSRERELAGTLPYVYPPNAPKNWHVSENSLSKDSSVNMNSKIDDYYADIIHNDKIERKKHSYTQIVQKRIKKNMNSLKKMRNKLDSEKNFNKLRLNADLIMANLYANKDYSKQIKVFDYENNIETIIDLDETKTLKENANILYKQYNKSKTSIEKLKVMTKSLSEEINYLEQIMYSIELADSMEDVLEIGYELEIETKKNSAKNENSIEPIKLVIDGAPVFVGRNNRQNDYIVSKLSKDEDYWFHTKDCAGSHVLLCSKNPSEKQIYECAKLAKQYSKASESPKVPVIYTKRKYLKKPPKANLGYVTYKNEAEIIV